MWYRLERFASEVQRSVERMDDQQWLVVSAVAIVLGALLLRGFGSRTTY